MFSSIDDMASLPIFFVPRSGRALVWPAYQGTLERIVGRPPTRSDRAPKDLMVQKVNDPQRTLDHLESRDDIDAANLVYLGLSAGAEDGPLSTAIDQRFKALVYLAGGFDDMHMLEEPAKVNPWHYTPRVNTPTLMVDGESDYGLPVETAQEPMFDLLGVSPEDKRHVLLEGEHVPNDLNAMVREILDWYDLHQGPVRSLLQLSIHLEIALILTRILREESLSSPAPVEVSARRLYRASPWPVSTSPHWLATRWRSTSWWPTSRTPPQEAPADPLY
jgi:hypothetical protein